MEDQQDTFDISPAEEPVHTIPPISKYRATILISTVALITALNAMLAGLLIVSLPTLAREIHLKDSLLLWPASVNSLACGCTLLLFGSVADVVGGKKVYLTGVFLLSITTVACGVCTSGIQLIVFRAAQGVALALALPSMVILITRSIPTGTYRNLAFACLGAGNPFGFSIGLVLGGVFVQTIGWRYGYYIGAIIAFVVFIISIYFVPPDPVTSSQSWSVLRERLRTEIDWVGCTLLSTSLGMFSYVLSVLSSGASHFVAPVTLTLFSVAVVLLPLFAFWVARQERLGKVAIMPPSLWRNTVFTSLCVTVFIVWGIFNAIQFFLTLFYQDIQDLKPIQTSIRFLPMVVTGAATNFLTGWLVKRVRADALVLGSASLQAISPLVLAFVKPEWSYWSCAFIATSCAPICADVLFTVANLVITQVYPHKTHGLAGGVFNTISNIGNSVGLAVSSVIASSVTLAAKGKKWETEKERLLDGYKATFWTCFAANVLVLGVVGFGLRRIGKVGIKTD
ncbi:integral membrane protein [Xylogone sp. PMI_703]|nr:integral membrane protein [Xylogone sp. PMI_703]